METGENAPTRAKVFWNGRSQAVRLPKQFRFEGNEVSIRRDGEAVILEPVKKRSWPPGYWEWIEENRAALDIGEIEPLGGALLDVTVPDE